MDVITGGTGQVAGRTRPQTGPALETHGLTRSYGARVAVDSVDPPLGVPDLVGLRMCSDLRG